ncbi:DUF6478 family protein [Pukyongiella litopenaei]|uniref:Plus3 domain-containing protein n=1 Tax=Pukyongiella litopenaei TaxID=2605946 RepID=A0A2S0MN05_9RHOB|nr:DUF6478 family protein [Pukyongiella litopenaei]AVO37268.1 hypothetical protein C6Y53_05770 [Pukyongiella litopenaei]
MGRILETLVGDRVLRHWNRAAAGAADLSQRDLRHQRDRARRLRDVLDRFLGVAETRLAGPEIGSSRFPSPKGADWTWRPGPWRDPLHSPGLVATGKRSDLSPGIALHHDCPRGEVSLRQHRNTGTADLAPFGLTLEVFEFTGSFLSLVIELPDDALRGLSKSHVIGIEVDGQSERETAVHARLNIRNGPNTEQILHQMTSRAGLLSAGFDLAYADLDVSRLGNAWIDLFVEAPAMNAFALRDLRLVRLRRSQF